VSDDAPAAAETGVGTRVAGYLLEEQIGRGGMAVVYRARDERLDRRVALKLLAPALAADTAFRARFIRESRAAAAVDHPNIIPVYDAGDAGGSLFIAMRYVHGGDARSLLRQAGPLPAGRVWAIVTQVAAALDAAHARGLIHRDVKPANILLDSGSPAAGTDPGLRLDDRAEHVYLADFGISKQTLSSHLTSTGQFVGTLDYVAPEQIEGRDTDGRADQYSLACAAFELISGTPPFRRDQGLALLYAQLNEAPPALSSRRRGIPAGADAVLAKALAKSPDERYPTCAQFAADLGRGLKLIPGEPEAGRSRLPSVGPAAGEPAKPWPATDLAEPAAADADQARGPADADRAQLAIPEVPAAGSAGAPQAGQPQAGTPQGGAPQAGTPLGGTPLGGAPQAGTPLGGTPLGGAPNVGTPLAGQAGAAASGGGLPAGDSPGWPGVTPGSGGLAGMAPEAAAPAAPGPPEPTARAFPGQDPPTMMSGSSGQAAPPGSGAPGGAIQSGWQAGAAAAAGYGTGQTGGPGGYGTGQTGGPGGYGTGQTGGPGGYGTGTTGPMTAPHGHRGLFVTVSSIVAVAIAAAAIAVFGFHVRFGPSPGTHSTPPTTPSTSPASSSTPTLAASEAGAVNNLLTTSAASRQPLQNAVSAVMSCTNLPGDVAQIQTVVNQRTAEYNKASALSTDALPNGAALKNDLRLALLNSLDADKDYLAWAQQQESNGCPSQSSAYSSALTADGQAENSKQVFVSVWNPIAETYGYAPASASSI